MRPVWAGLLYVICLAAIAAGPAARFYGAGSEFYLVSLLGAIGVWKFERRRRRGIERNRSD
ncbi:hypothetical protein [Alkalicoccus luteus]|uniref:Uncharacterized protein n=1 Tax=Alkalicoccus luteus TaxID=1237094 RepID=A0A969TTU1_9BACI|nr:hypothetical protein [Alkalicoccus luteus]NJP36640.1 hypothetical protein [Alkalicoccus luteus]